MFIFNRKDNDLDLQTLQRISLGEVTYFDSLRNVYPSRHSKPFMGVPSHQSYGFEPQCFTQIITVNIVSGGVFNSIWWNFQGFNSNQVYHLK